MNNVICGQMGIIYFVRILNTFVAVEGEKIHMTVKELKEKLNEFDEHLIVMIPNTDYDSLFPYALATNVGKGVNEADGCVFIDSYEED
jgi:hypothetical protein